MAQQQNKLSYFSFLFILTIGLLIRLFLINKTQLRQWFENRVEISTPLTSWNRVLEGIYHKRTIGLSNSYQCDIVNEIPIMLKFYEILVCLFTKEYINYVFIFVDGLNSIVLYLISIDVINYLTRLEETNTKKGKYKNFTNEAGASQDKFLLNSKNFNVNYWSLFTLAVYLFNPFGWASCVALSTVVFQNLFLLSWLYFLINGNVVVSFLFLGMHANITVYSVVLIIASISFLIQRNFGLGNQAPNQNLIIKSVLNYLITFLLITTSIFMLNLYLENFNTRFIECTYLFIMKIPDLVPNLGLFWYFFTEMFDHFIVFFTFVFQFNAFIYSIPLTIRLKDDPVVNIFLQVGFLSILKSYPSVGETGLYISLLPMLSYLFPLMRNFLVYSCMLLASTVLAPIMFYLWLGSGGGNANFYFAITLVSSVGQIFLLVDVLYANLKSEFIKTNGAEIPKLKDGSLAAFSLE